MPLRLNLPSILLLLIGSIPVTARAHHPAEIYEGHALPVSSLQASAAYGRFSLEGRKGSYYTGTLGGEGVLFDRLGVGATLPLHRLSFQDGERYSGIGDLGTRVRYSLRLTDVVISPFLQVALPTGDSHVGLGSGHYDIEPGASVHWSLGSRVSLHGSLSYHRSFGGHEHEEENAQAEHTHDEASAVPASEIQWVSPHAEAELSGHLGVSYRLATRVSATVALSDTYALVRPREHFLVVIPSASFDFSEHWTLQGETRLPVTSPQRFTVRPALMLHYRIGHRHGPSSDATKE